MKKHLLIYTLFCFTFLTAQEYGDKDFYLVDSLNLKQLGSFNKNLIDSIITLYHEEESDTGKLFQVNQILGFCTDMDALWKYNNYLLQTSSDKLKKVRNKAVEKRLKYFKATALANKGVLYDYESEMDSAFKYYKLALDIHNEIESFDGIAHVKGALGVYYDIKGDVKKAFQYYSESLKAAEQSNEPYKIAEALLNFATIQKDYGDFDEALKNSLETIAYAKEANADQTLLMSYQNISNIYKKKTQYKEGIKYAKLATHLAKKIDSDYWYADSKFMLGLLYNSLNMPDSALLHLKDAKKIAEKLGAEDLFFLSIKGIASAEFKLGNNQKAKQLGEDAFSYFQKLNSKHYKAATAKLLYNVYEEMEDFEAAFKMTKLYIANRDSLFNDENKQKAIGLGIKYDYEKKMALIEQEKMFAEKLAKKNSNLFIISVISGLLLFILALFIIYQIQLKKRVELAEIKLTETENKLQLERKLTSAEMKALRAQMNPHFLFNAFNSIQEYIIMNNRELASDYLGKFADLMRIYLDHSREKTISLENEIEATELYLELEKIRFEDNLEYTINIQNDIDTSQIDIPPMLIQPFIENSLKHGLLHKKNNRKLSLDFSLKNKQLLCIVEDNGIGRKKAALLNEKKLKKHKSFATTATQNRIELLNIGRENPIQINIFDLEDDKSQPLGTRIIITIPL